MMKYLAPQCGAIEIVPVALQWVWHNWRAL